MDERKLIQHGKSSLTIALPIKWLKERDLKKGEKVFIKEEGNKLIISTKKSLNIEKISTDITKLDRTSIILYLQSLYRFGYNEIEIKFSKSYTYHHKKKEEVSISSVVQLIINRLIGSEIIDQTNNKIIIKHLSNDDDQDFKLVLRRILRLLKETSQTLLKGIEEQDYNLINSIEDMHDNINKFVSYCLRLLNKYGYPDTKKTSYYFHIIASIDKVVDLLKYSARDFKKYNKKPNRQTIEIIRKINYSIEIYYQLFYNFNQELVNKLEENRSEIKRRLKSRVKKIPHEEILYLTNLKQITELLLDLADFRMGLEH